MAISKVVGLVAAASILVAACSASQAATSVLNGTTYLGEDEGLVAVAQTVREAVVFIHPARGHKGGSGVGFLFRPDGYILTNAHVVDDITAIEVILLDGRKFERRLVGLVESKKPDVAVVKIESPEPLPVLSLGADPKPGDTVLAIGHVAMTSFWVPIAGRVVTVERESIRVDMPSFFGMSGAPLVDLNGRVVGLLFGTKVPRVEHPTVAPLEVIKSWEEFGKLKPPVSAVIVESLKREVDRILKADT